ncbi:SID1 transmembrane family member 1 [Orchesella cincta]|uniref:SID1 transmembrane family member 1 n=1 Tax=Orchesella cincta TaxID=48709 RepID=A0A1D2M6E3_ORCCI|nr:SID1 transmembrane family member 1 [Orchesella cincta]
MGLTLELAGFNMFMLAVFVISGSPLVVLSSYFVPNPSATNDTFNKLYSDTVNNTIQKVYLYDYKSLEKDLSNINLRLEVATNACAGATNLSALSFTVLKPSTVSSSFRLPTFYKRNGSPLDTQNPDNYKAERTICIFHANASDTISITVVLSTGSLTSIPFSIRIIPTEDLSLKLNAVKPLTITPNIPSFYSLQFPSSPSLTSARVFVDSECLDKICMTISVQRKMCPVFDQERSIHYEGIFQTITSRGALIVKREDPFEEGFIIVLIAHPSYGM